MIHNMILDNDTTNNTWLIITEIKREILTLVSMHVDNWVIIIEIIHQFNILDIYVINTGILKHIQRKYIYR